MTRYDERSATAVERLLRRAGASIDVPPDLATWQRLVGAVHRSLSDLERDRYLLERSLDMTTQDVESLRVRLEAAMARLRREQEAIATAWQRQRALAMLGRRAIEGVAFAEMLRDAAELAAAAVGAPAATIVERRDGEGLVLRASVGLPADVAAAVTGAAHEHPTVFAEDELARRVFDDPHGSVVLHDAGAAGRGSSHALLEISRARSSVVARIGSASEPFGLIGVHHHEPGVFGADHELFVSELARVLTLVMARERHAEWLAHKAFHDDLTGLPNRALLRDRLENGLERSHRSGALVTLLLFDLDGFKLINDSRGHAVGDRLLIDVARRLRSLVREGDTPARLGGDEFAVLLDDTTPAEATALARRVLDAFRSPFPADDGEVFVGASIGLADNAHGPLDADELLVRADLAMYAAKARGRDRVEVFDPGMKADLNHRHQLHGDLQAALTRNEFHLYYQPLVDLTTGRVESLEALIRWNHPDEGLLSPDKFLAVADETNLTVPIGRFVLAEACRQLAEWRRDGLVADDVRVGVNITAKQFYDLDFATDVARALLENDVPARNLILELTEGTLLVDTGFMQVRLAELRDLGVRIAVDDFGTGYSSLAYLRSFPVDYIKIDRAFVQELRDDPDGGSVMIRSIIGLGHNLDLRVVAEGIEVPDQLTRISDAGCDVGQGYLFARPMPPHALRSLLGDAQQRRAEARRGLAAGPAPLGLP